MARLYANNYSTILTAGVTAVATTITVASVTGLPAIGGADTCQLTLDDGAVIEIVTATAVAGLDITVTRAQEGTTGTAFISNTVVALRATALSFTVSPGLNDVVDDLTPQLGGDLDLNSSDITGTGNINHTGNLTTSGVIDFNAATAMKVPQSATPTVSANGHIAIDTTVTDFSHGVMKYFGGEEMGVVSMPIAQFTTPSDGYAVTYNATNDEFELTASGGLANVVEDTTPESGGNFNFLATSIYWTGGNPGVSYFINASGGLPYIQGPDTNHRIAVNNDGFTITHSTGKSTQWQSGNVIHTGEVINMGGTTSLEIPNGAAPSLTVTGQIALDTTVTDWSQGVLKYYSGEVFGVVSMPDAEFTSPVDRGVPKYNATADEFQLETSDLTFISSATASASASVSFTGLSSVYIQYIVVFTDVIPATDAVDFRVRTSTDNGVSYDSGASDYAWIASGDAVVPVASPATENLGDDADDKIRLFGGAGSAANETVSGKLTLYAHSTTTVTGLTSTSFGKNAAGNWIRNHGFGQRLSAADVDALEFSMSSGNIASGTFKLYGLRAS